MEGAGAGARGARRVPRVTARAGERGGARRGLRPRHVTGRGRAAAARGGHGASGAGNERGEGGFVPTCPVSSWIRRKMSPWQCISCRHDLQVTWLQVCVRWVRVSNALPGKAGAHRKETESGCNSNCICYFI